jgi:hypothetical protein
MWGLLNDKYNQMEKKWNERDDTLVQQKNEWNDVWIETENRLRLERENLQRRELEAEKNERKANDMLEKAIRQKEFSDFMKNMEAKLNGGSRKQFEFTTEKPIQFIPESPQPAWLRKEQGDSIGNAVKNFDVWSDYQDQMEKKWEADFDKSSNKSAFDLEAWWNEQSNEKNGVVKENEVDVVKEKKRNDGLNNDKKREKDDLDSKRVERITERIQKGFDKDLNSLKGEKLNERNLLIAALTVAIGIIISLILVSVALCCRSRKHVLLNQNENEN